MAIVVPVGGAEPVGRFLPAAARVSSVRPGRPDGSRAPGVGESATARESTLLLLPIAAMKNFERLADLAPLVGQEIGVSDWIAVEQDRIDRFAEATGDHQWIHVDPVRAAAGPFGTPVAHGFLTLSLLPEMGATAFGVADTRMGVNYGLNRVRFTAPVPVGSRLRGRFKLQAYEPIEGGAQLTMQVTMEREGADKPVCVAESLSRRYL